MRPGGAIGNKYINTLIFINVWLRAIMAIYATSRNKR
jgi:hypothetical protein